MMEEIKSTTQYKGWVPTHVHSHFSLQDGFSKPEDIAEYCRDQGYKAAACTDHGSGSALTTFFKACKKFGIKSLLGIEGYLCEQPATIKSPENRHLSHIVMLSKNLQGWKNLVRFISETNKPEHFYYKPRACWGMLKEFLGDGNTIAISGHCGSSLGEVIWTSPQAYRCKSAEESRQYLWPDWKERAIASIEKHIETFGKNNFFVEIQLIDEKFLPMTRLAAECFREIVKESNGRYLSVGTSDSHYVRREDAQYQRIMLASNLGLTLPKIRAKMNSGEDVPLGNFFISNNYHIPTFDEMRVLHTDEELNNSVLIADMCEDYDILSKPKLPHFICPDGLTEISYLRQLCEEGWQTKLVGGSKIQESEQEKKYKDRLEMELGVIDKANLSGYFLIVWDITNFCRSLTGMSPTGRGCFLPDSRVKMWDGMHCPISIIKIGDIVIDAYGNPQKVLNTLSYYTDEEILELTMSSGAIIRCTKDHKFLTENRGWVQAQNLNKEDEIKEV